MNDSRVWLTTATRLARRLDTGRWLEKTLPVWAGTSVVAACALLMLRNRSTVDASWVWVGVLAAFVGTGLIVYVMDTRHHRVSREQALVWLEHRLNLHNRLTAASAGVGAWPEPRPEALELLEWRPARIVPSPLFSVALIVAAMLIPVTPDTEAVPPPIAPPLAWTEMERWLDAIEETEIVDEQAVESWQERVDSLKNQPEQEWYTHSSLEAGDSLREELASEMRALERSLAEAEASLTEMLELEDDASPEKRRLSRKRLASALEDLDLATLPLSPKMKRQLMTLTRGRDVKPMTAEQLARLRERLRERKYANLPRPGDGDAYGFLVPGGMGDGSEGDGRGPSSGESANGQPSRGGVSRGPGTAPLELASERTELGTNRVEDVFGQEPLGTELGDNVAVGIGEHDVDTSGFRRGRDAGSVAATGEGGELVWSQTLTPEDRRILKRYFK